MFKNLKAEMARNDLKNQDIAKCLSVSEKTVSNKMCGTTEFTRSEMATVKKKFFPSLSMDYLFDTDE